MRQAAELKRGYISLVSDKRVNVWHISIYIALLYMWEKNKRVNPLYITRNKIMKLSHISSIATYHKCIKQLQEFGYIHYVPSYNRFTGTQVFLTLIPS